MPSDPPKRAYCSSKNFLPTPLSKSSPLPSEASTKGILGTKCLLLVKYKQLQKGRMKKFIHCILATDNSVGHLFMGSKNFQSVIKLGSDQILCNNTETNTGKNSLLQFEFFWENSRDNSIFRTPEDKIGRIHKVVKIFGKIPKFRLQKQVLLLTSIETSFLFLSVK